MNFRFFILCFVMFIFVGSNIVIAAGAVDANTNQPVSDTKNNDPVSGGTKSINTSYQEMSYANLFRLAWVMDAVNPKNDEALDNYLMIAECDLYKKFYTNEFEWEKIRSATLKYLAQYTANHSPYYEYMQPLPLGRYDSHLEGFPVENPENYKGLRVLQMANYDIGETKCQRFYIDSYKFPSAAALQLVSPFNLTFIRVPQMVAENYLAWREKERIASKNNRVAYIKYRVRIDKFLDIRRMEAMNTYVFAGRLMQIDVYADKEMLRPLYNQAY